MCQPFCQILTHMTNQVTVCGLCSSKLITYAWIFAHSDENSWLFLVSRKYEYWVMKWLNEIIANIHVLSF